MERPNHLAGVYDADRASALSGVPKSTVHYWARRGIVAPSISPVRTKLWSYTDLLSLRAVSWLRHEERNARSEVVRRAVPFKRVEAALVDLRQRADDLWFKSAAGDDVCALLVTADGHVFLRTDAPVLVEPLTGQRRHEQLNVLGEVRLANMMVGPDLIRPRPALRIVPGKLAGEPHVEGTRITSRMIAGLAGRGFDVERILKLYPRLTRAAAEQAVDLEESVRAA